MGRKPLTLFQNILYALLYTGIASSTALLEGVVLFYYNDQLKVSLEYLGLTNFVIGAVAAYVAVFSGNLSDRSKLKYRRKSYILMFGPLYAIGLFFRLGAFTSVEAAPAYYAIAYFVQIVGFTGFEVITTAWGVELATEVADRSRMYTVATAVGFCAIFIGIILAVLPLIVSAFLVPGAMVTTLILSAFYLPDKTPINKRAFVPTIANLSSTLWNSQFMIYLVTMCFTIFINTVPQLMLFFIKYCLGINGSIATTYYSLMLAVFVLMGLAVVPFIQGIIKRFGKHTSIKASMLIATAMGMIVLVTSYISVWFIIIAFGFIGMFSTVSNVVLSIIYAEIIDYDELLTGKKRGSSYAAVYGPIRSFIVIAGGSIPLMLMSVLGFEAPTDDHDDDGGTSTFGSTLVLRLWCSLFMSFVMFCGYLSISRYGITEEKHKLIVTNTEKRDMMGLNNVETGSGGEGVNVGSAGADGTVADTGGTDGDLHADTGVLGEIFSEVRHSNLFQDDMEKDSLEMYAHSSSKTRSGGTTGSSRPFEQDTVQVPLGCVDDPLTGLAVEPPPFAIAIQTIDRDIMQTEEKFPNSIDHLNVRLLALYFPQLLHVTSSKEGRNMMLALYGFELSTSVLFLGLGLWQSVNVLAAQSQYGSILFVLLTVFYSFVLVYHVLKFKGMKILHQMQQGESRGANNNSSSNSSDVSCGESSDLELMLQMVSSAMYQPQAINSVGNTMHENNSSSAAAAAVGDGGSVVSVSASAAGSSHRLPVGQMQRKAIVRFWFYVALFVLAYIAVNI